MKAVKINRVLLVYPNWKTDELVMVTTILEPLALEYLAAAMPSMEVRIIDMRLEPDLEKAMLEFKPDMIGFTGYSRHAYRIKELAVFAKSIMPEAAIIVGGRHATLMPGDFDINEIDLVVVGEGCSAIKELIENNWNPKGIPGVAFREGGKQCFNPLRQHPPLDDLPMPRRDLIKKYQNKYHIVNHYGVATIRTSMGCHFRCKFCSHWRINEGRYFTREMDRIIEELKGIKQKNIFFADDESMLDIDRMDMLADKIKKAGIKKRYILWARIETILNHQSLFKKWRDIGLVMVFVGYESFSDERLANFNKHVTVEMQRQATLFLKKIGIAIFATFIVEQDYDLRDFASLYQHLRALKLNIAEINALHPYPGMLMYDEMPNTYTKEELELFNGEEKHLPTIMPARQFCYKLNFVRRNAVPLWRKVCLLLKYPTFIIPQIAYNVLKNRIKADQYTETIIKNSSKR